MTTSFTKRVRRITDGEHRGRKLVVSLAPGDIIEIREAGRRTVETLTAGGAYDFAVQCRVNREKFIKKQQKKNGRYNKPLDKSAKL